MATIPSVAASFRMAVIRYRCGDLQITHHDVSAAPPSPSGVDTSGNYAILAQTGDMNGGTLRLIGFSSAHLILDQERRQTSLHTSGQISLHGASGQGLGIALAAADGARVDLVTGDFGGRIDATFALTQEDTGGISAAVTYAAGAGAPLELRRIDHKAGTMELNLRAPPQLKAAFTYAQNPRGEPVATLNIDAGAPTVVYLFMLDEWGGVTTLNIDTVPPRMDAQFTFTTCGLDATLTSSAQIELLQVTYDPTSNNGRETGGIKGTSPGCAVTKTTAAKGGTSTTSVIARFEGVPSGTLEVTVNGGDAGRVKMSALSTPLRRVEIYTRTLSDKGEGSLLLVADDVRLRLAEWDTDGDTRSNTLPQKSIFLDTGGSSSGRLIFDLDGKFPMWMDTNGRFIARPFRLEWSGVPTYAGCLQLLDHSGDRHLELSLPRWFGPVPAGPVARAWFELRGEYGRC